MIEIPAARDDLEISGIADRPAQISEAKVAKAAQRLIGRHFRKRGFDLGPEAALGFLGDRRHQRIPAFEMPERRARRDAGAAGGLAYAHRRGPAPLGQLQRRVDQDAPQVAMVIGLRRRAAQRPVFGSRQRGHR